MLSLSMDRQSQPRVPDVPSDLEDWVARARRGDAWGAEMLYRAHLADVTRVATFVLGRSSEVEDVVHDAFVRALDRLDQLENADAFGGWLARIAINLARSRLRQRKWLRTFWLDDDGEDIVWETLVAPGASPEQEMELTLVAGALKRLPPDVRVAWVLRRVEGWPLAEIAASLNVSLATAKRRVDDGETALRRHTGRDT